MTRKIKYFVITLFAIGLFFLLAPSKAHADDTTSIQAQIAPDTSSDPAPIINITTPDIQSKINSATALLNTTSQADSTAIITAIQANVPNADTQTTIQIATSQEPILSAIDSATTQIEIAHQAIDSATVALNIANNNKLILDSQTVIVSQAQLFLDTSTALLNDAQNTLTIETAKLSDLQLTSDTTQSNFYTENSNLGTATSNLDIAQNNLTSAQTDLTNNGTITVTTNGITASVYNAGGRSPALPASNATPVLTTTVPQIVYNWGSGSVLGARADGVIVKFTGTITIPNEASSLRYAVYSDDGALLYIDNQVAINNWRDQGPTWSPYSQTYDVSSNKQQTFTLWYYENGGGAVCTLGWMIIRADGTGYFTSPTAINFGTNTTTQDPVKVAAVNTAQNNLSSAQSAYATQLSIRDSAYQAWQDAINAVNAQQSVIDSAQATYSTAQQNLIIAQQNLTTEQQNLTMQQQNLNISLQTANSLADTATVAVQSAVTAMDNAVSVTNDYYAQLAAAKAAADKAAADAAAAKAQADALAAQKAAAKAQADALAAQQAAQKAAADKAAADAAAAKAQADALAAQQAADKAAADKAAADKAAADQAAKDAQAKADAAKAEADAKAAAQQAADQAAKDAQAKADAAKAAADKAKQDTIGVVPNSPDQLSDTVVKEAPAEALVPHIQQDVKGVENGGIQFFGTKSQPQVVGEDGKLTPPPPPPGSGLPIPPEAITTKDTFIGQPGGTTFNAPDIFVPVDTITVTVPVPGAQALADAYVALANIGADMSPVTRKKAKKILVLTVAVSAIRRRFGQ